MKAATTSTACAARNRANGRWQLPCRTIGSSWRPRCAPIPLLYLWLFAGPLAPALANPAPGVADASTAIVTTSVAIVLLVALVWTVRRLRRLQVENGRAKNALAESDDQIRRVLDNLFAFVGILQPDGTLIDANRAPLDAAGIELDDVRGRKFWDCYWWSHDPALQAQLRDAVRRAAQGETSRYDVVARMANDTRMSIDFMLAPMRDAQGRVIMLIPSAIDITGRTASERRLRDSEARFRRVLDSTADGLVQIDESGRIVLANRRLESMFGYTQQELHLAPVETLMPARHRDAHPALREAFFAKPETRDMAQRRELYARRKDGTEFPVEIGLNPMHTPEGMHVLATIVDVTVRYEARRALERALEEKTILLNEIHHRVKNNLQVISSLLNMQSRRAPPQVQHALEESQARVKAMALIHQMLYEGKVFADVDLGPYLERLCSLLRQSFLGHRGGIQLVLDAGNQSVCVDLQRAVPCGLLVNELATNAMKHAFPAGRSGRIEVRLRRPVPGCGEIVVGDDGVGLPDDVAPGVTRSLGFQLIPALCDQLEGQLRLERENGTRFIITFPISDGEP